jgi:hypothetical protein
MVTKNSASGESIHDLRGRVLQALPYRDDLLLDLIDALAVGPRPATPSEVVISPLWGFAGSTLYSGLREGADPATLAALRQARLEWWEQWGESLREPEAGLGQWRVRVLDATNYDRPKTRTVRVGYVHGAEGMKPGHALSVLSERAAEGSWYLPLEIALIPVEHSPTEFGAEQIVDYVRRWGWEPEDVLAVDAAYTNEPTLRPMVEAGVNVLGRVSAKRVFYLPPPPYSGHGRPRVRGHKIKLSDQRTLPQPNGQQRVEVASGGWYEISQWEDVRMRKWPTQPLVLYRVWEYKADGTRRYHRPLWLLYVGSSAAPKPPEAQAIYEHRFGIEHSLRLMKGELSLDGAQFNGQQAEQRVALWVEVVATVMWVLFALRKFAQSNGVNWPQWWRGRRLTPGAVRRVALALFVKLGIRAPQPQVRGKSPGRAVGTRLQPRKRYRIFRKRRRRAAA